MSKLKKAALMVLIAPTIMVGCSATQGNYIANENASIKSGLTPLSEHIKGFALQGCDNKISIENYKQIMDERVTGLYGSPLSKSCVPISFEEFEPQAFYEDIISRSSDPDSAREIIATLMGQGFSDGHDDMSARSISLKDGRVAQVIRFNDGKVFSDLKSMWKDRDDMLAYIDEYVFLHELFHLSAMNLDRSLPKNVREGLSDVSTVITLSTKYQLTLDQTIDLAEDVYRGRYIEASQNPHGVAYEGSHFNKQILTDMVSYLKDLKSVGGDLRRVASLKEANEYAMDMVLNLNNTQRLAHANGDLFWERGMDVPDTPHKPNAGVRRSFEEIMSISADSATTTVSSVKTDNSKDELSGPSL